MYMHKNNAMDSSIMSIFLQITVSKLDLLANGVCILWKWKWTNDMEHDDVKSNFHDIQFATSLDTASETGTIQKKI